MLVVHGSINIVVVALYFYRFDQHFFNGRGRRDADYIKKKMKPRLDKHQMKKKTTEQHRADGLGHQHAPGSTELQQNTRLAWDIIDPSLNKNPAQSDWFIDTNLHKLWPIGFGQS